MTSQAVRVTAGDEPSPIRKRHIAAVVTGNALEFYDFLTFAFFAVYIGRAFFPSANPTSSLLLTLATFGAGFATRPLGGLFIGSFGDKMGRRPAMVFSFSLMGCAIAAFGLLPSYAVIGIAASILVLLLRLLQGFALGGVVGPVTAYLIESAPPKARGLYGSLQSAAQNVAVLIAGIVFSLLAALMSAQALQDWGWRIAFLLGAAIIPFCVAIQRTIPETMHAAPADRQRGARGRIRDHLKVAVLGMLMLASGSISIYVMLYLSTYAMVTLHMPARAAAAVTTVIGICGIIFAPVGGALSDRFGRKPIILLFGALLLGAVIPAFHTIAHYRMIWALCLAAAILAILWSLMTTPVLVAITELLPPSIRAGGVGTIYALAIAVFGGSTQFNIAWLTAKTGNPIAPAWYMTAALVVGLSAAACIEESAPPKGSVSAYNT